jgi:hypothetical protein
MTDGVLTGIVPDFKIDKNEVKEMVILTNQPNFFPATELICHYGRIILGRVRNTDSRSRPDPLG